MDSTQLKNMSQFGSFPIPPSRGENKQYLHSHPGADQNIILNSFPRVWTFPLIKLGSRVITQGFKWSTHLIPTSKEDIISK